MKLTRCFTAILALAAASVMAGAVLRAETTATAAPETQTPTVQNQGPELSEGMLRRRYVGKTVFLRGGYVGDSLGFDEYGHVKGSPRTQSFTLSALQIKNVHLDKNSLKITADRYALHFFGVLPYEETTKRGFDKVKISKKPVQITIQRELIVKPKKKKQPKKEKQATAKPAAGAEASTAVSAAQPPVAPLKPGTTLSPAHSAMMMEKALNNVFATSIDDRMIAAMPAYWRRYFISKRDHREFTPSGMMQVGNGVSAPQLLTGLDPSSNRYAQKFGVAGLTLFRTVIDASGKPVEVAIARPIGFGLDENAVNAIKKSRFKPAMKDGSPVPVVTDLVVTFRIYSNRTEPGSVRKGTKLTEVVASAWDPVVTSQPTKSKK